MKKFLLVIIILALIAAAAYYFLRKQGIMQPPGEVEVVVPLKLADARGVGGIQVELGYDSALLTAVGVDVGDLSRNAMVDYNLDAPGRVAIAVIDQQGFRGSGSAVEVTFKALGRQGSCPLKLDGLRAYEVRTLYELVAEPSDGQFSAPDAAVTPPVIDFGGR
jgi:hypothetical protein